MSLFARGGVRPDDKKKATEHKSIELLPAPAQVVIPLSLHIGTSCEPVVSVNQTVLIGQKIADSSAPVSAPVHASVSGKIAAIEPRLHPNGTQVTSIVIENDGQYKLHEDVAPQGSVESLSAEQLLNIIRQAGIVGLGGAVFPTHEKIRSATGRVQMLIINAAECEPYITADLRVMMESPEEVIGGTRVLMKILGLSRAMIGVESNKYIAAESLRRTLPRKGGDIRVKVLPTRYPQGAEKMLIRKITGREVPPGALPFEAGVIVFNVSTAAAIHRAVTGGIPLTTRVVTVAGSAVSNPKNFRVAVGTPLSALFEATGGFKEQPFKVIMGGPMMGVAQHDLNVPVIKATNGVLAFSRQEGPTALHPACIRCGRCVSACPMRLLPLYLYQYEQKNDCEQLNRLHVQDCIECGCCAYVCPGRLFLVQSMRTGKLKLRQNGRKQGAGVMGS